MNTEAAARRLAEKAVEGVDVHQLNTLNLTKVKLLQAVHDLGSTCSQIDLVEALDLDRQYVSRMASELIAQGILVRLSPTKGSPLDRRAAYYRCICFTTEEGNEQ